jgi:N-acetyl-anhydromuramyl-L-alanine amidase AmpD
LKPLFCIAVIVPLLALAPGVSASSQKAALAWMPAAQKKSAKSSTKKKSSAKGKKRSPVSKQTQPDAQRSREIQEALQREGYLTSAPSGKWDAATSDALARYQKEHGYSPTGKPDARSLNKLGLGAKHPPAGSPPTPN